jgi:hypothetical protein
MSLPGTWSGQDPDYSELYRNTPLLNKSCERKGNLLPLQRLLTTIRYSNLNDLDFIPRQQFSIYSDLKDVQLMINGQVVERSNEK